MTQKAKRMGSTSKLRTTSKHCGGTEGYPYMSEDGKTLYFSGRYHLGMGGLDLFKVEKMLMVKIY